MAQGLTEPSLGAPFESIAELRLVPGIGPGLLASLAPHLSLYRDGDPEVAAADPVVREAIRALAGSGTAERRRPAVPDHERRDAVQLSASPPGPPAAFALTDPS